MKIEETFVKLDDEIARLVEQLQRERLERMEKAAGAVKQPAASTEHRAEEKRRTVRRHRSAHQTESAAIGFTTLGSIARRDC